MLFMSRLHAYHVAGTGYIYIDIFYFSSVYKGSLISKKKSQGRGKKGQEIKKGKRTSQKGRTSSNYPNGDR